MKKQRTMTLDEFIKEANRDLRRFRKYWKSERRILPHVYPAELESGEWDEQLALFLEHGDEE